MEYTVAAVQEALAVLMIVAHNPGLGVTEIAKRSGNTKARTFRLLATLESASFIQRDKDSTTYSLGHIALVLGLAAQEQVGITRLAVKHLDALQARFNETVGVLVRDGVESVSIAQKHTTHEVRVQGNLGRRRPLHAGASGKLLLAYAPPEIQAEVLEGGLEKFTPHTITGKTKLKQELKRICEQGYALSSGEVAADVVAIAAPVFNDTGAVQAALSFSIPTTRAPADLSKMIQAVRQSAADLSAELGWRKAS
jgi:IclR family KDG regulon transcriptional repressor